MGQISCQSFACFSSMCGANVVEYLIDDPNSLHKSTSDFSISSKQPDSDRYYFFFERCHNVGPRLLILCSQHQVLCPSPKKANQYALICFKCQTWTHLHARRDLQFIRQTCPSSYTLDITCNSTNLFPKKIGGKQNGRLSNTWFDSKYWEARQHYHIVLNSSHLVNTSRIAFKNIAWRFNIRNGLIWSAN